jgi:phenylpyruvate tautomerase PptA (4-oxalocrotonate tautomerase family)
MPLVQVTLRKGRPAEFLQKAGNAIHEALIEHAKIPAGDRFQIFHEVKPGHIVADPAFAGARRVERSDELLIVQITLNEGRTDEIKSALYAGIGLRLSALGVRLDDLFINLVEVKKQNWSMGAGVMTYPA